MKIVQARTKLTDQEQEKKARRNSLVKNKKKLCVQEIFSCKYVLNGERWNSFWWLDGGWMFFARQDMFKQRASRSLKQTSRKSTCIIWKKPVVYNRSTSRVYNVNFAFCFIWKLNPHTYKKWFINISKVDQKSLGTLRKKWPTTKISFVVNRKNFIIENLKQPLWLLLNSLGRQT